MYPDDPDGDAAADAAAVVAAAAVAVAAAAALQCSFAAVTARNLLPCEHFVPVYYCI